MNFVRRIVCFMMVALFAAALPVQAFAETYDLADGAVIITADESGQYSNRKYGEEDTRTEVEGKGYKETETTVITQSNSGTATKNTITITGGGEADVTLDGVNIKTDYKSSGLTVDAETKTSANVTLVNDNTIFADSTSRAAVSVGDGASLTITEESTGSLTAKTREDTDSAGIGGSNSYYGADAGSITINGGTVTAYGGGSGAGIGGGSSGNGGTTTINGGMVTASSAQSGAGIGGGAATTTSPNYGDGGIITINGGKVTATSGSDTSTLCSGAGIGGGSEGNGGIITITGGEVTASSTLSGAGIGGGTADEGGVITITGGTVIATGGDTDEWGRGNGAGIGGGSTSKGSKPAEVTITGGTVTATAGKVTNEEYTGPEVDGLSGSATISGDDTVVIEDGETIYPDVPTQPDPAPTPTPAPTPAPAPEEVIVEAEKPVEVTVEEKTLEVKAWVSVSEGLEGTDVLIVETAEAPDLSANVEASKIIGIFDLSLKSGETELKDGKVFFDLGTDFAGQTIIMVYSLNGERVEVESTVDADGILSFPLSLLTVVMLVQK